MYVVTNDAKNLFVYFCVSRWTGVYTHECAIFLGNTPCGSNHGT